MSTVEQENAMLEAARRGEIKNLWQKYNFPDRPPPEGSESERRMFDYAEQYVKCVLGVEDRSMSGSVQHASEVNQRELHNQLTIMIYGVPRSSMPSGDPRAYHVSDFAAGIAYPGDTIESIRKRMKEGVREE